MKTKIIPFDLETAKKIKSGEVKGRIVTEDRKNVRMICFDLKHPECPIIAAVTYDDLADESNATYEVVHYFDQNGYFCNNKQHYLNLSIELPEEAPEHKFKPFDKVLVRENDASLWRAGFYSHELDGKHCICGNYYSQCISYEGNQDLVGTTNKPKEE